MTLFDAITAARKALVREGDLRLVEGKMTGKEPHASAYNRLADEHGRVNR